MNGLSLNDLLCLFCCPPFPSSIVSKLAFLPPQPTYKLVINDYNEHTNTVPHCDDNETIKNEQILTNNEQQLKQQRMCSTGICTSFICKTGDTTRRRQQQQKLLFTNAQLQLSDKAEWQYGASEMEKLEVFLCRTQRGHKIACLFVHCVAQPKYTILFSHGNAVDLGQMSSFYYGLGCRLQCNIFTYDYSGYGVSEGRPTEKNLYTDIEAAWNALRSRYGISPSNIILYGQSIGTVPTVDLASRYDCAGVVLHAPLMSGMRVAFNTKRTWCCDAFPTIDKVNRISSLVLVIHGTDDEVIDFSHGLAIHQKCQKPVDPLWVDGAGHNDIEIYSQYIDRLRYFVNYEISHHQQLLISQAANSGTKDSNQINLTQHHSLLNPNIIDVTLRADVKLQQPSRSRSATQSTSSSQSNTTQTPTNQQQPTHNQQQPNVTLNDTANTNTDSS